MITPPTPTPPPNSRALRTILLAGLLAGALDIGYVFVYFNKSDPLAILRGIAAGLLGPSARQGGPGTAALGLMCHFTIALGAAAVFYAASRRLTVLVRQPWVSGPLYGVAVWLVMNLVVVPLSAIPARPFPPPSWIPILVAHLVCVGPPIAFVVARMMRGAR